MPVARVRISKIRLKPSAAANPVSRVYQLHFGALTENGETKEAVFSKWAGKYPGPWQMQPQGTFGRQV